MKKPGTSEAPAFSFPKLSLRQQTLLAIQLSKSDGFAPHSPKTLDHDTRELSVFLEDDARRERKPAPAVQYQRSKLLEEAGRLFKHVKKNIFLERKPMKVPVDADWMICECKAPYKLPTGILEGRYTVGCGLRCFNRLMSTECLDSLCRLEEACTNRRFQRHEHLQVYPQKTANRGWGLVAGQKIRKNQFVIQYMGEIYYIDSEVGRRRLEKYRGSTDTYLMSITQNEVIDPTKKGNEARFINHSCDPNCETQKWNVLGEVRIGIFAKRDIEENEELTFDYRFDTLKTALTRCLCGAANCKRYLGVIQMDLIMSPIVSEPCSICLSRRDNDLTLLVWCDECGLSFHLDCLSPRLSVAPAEAWVCSNCNSKKANIKIKHLKAKRHKEAVKKQQILIAEMQSQKLDLPVETPEKRFTIAKGQLGILRGHLEDILREGSKVFWTGEGETVEVTLRDGDVQSTFEVIQQYLESEAVPKDAVEPNLGDITDLSVVVPVVYLRYVLGSGNSHVNEYLESYRVNLHYDTEAEMEALRPLEDLTVLYITGYKSNAEAVVSLIYNILDCLTMSTLNLQDTECRSLELNLADIRRTIDPVDLRIAASTESYTSSHPFYSYTKTIRRIALVGKEQEVENAEKLVLSRLPVLTKDYPRVEEYVLLMPITTSEMLKRVRRDIARSAASPSDRRNPDIRIPESVQGALYLPVELNGSWEQIMRMKVKLDEEVNSRLGYGKYAVFTKSVQPTIYRTLLKSTASYIHLMEKRYLYQTLQEKRTWGNKAYAQEMMVYWDFITCEVFSEKIGNSVRKAVISDILQDDESRVSLLRVAKDEGEIKLLLDQLGTTPRQALEIVSRWFKETMEKTASASNRTVYSPSLIDELASYYDFTEGSAPISAARLMEDEVNEVRKMQQQSHYPILSLDYSFDTRALLGLEHLPQDVDQYFAVLEKRTLVPAEDGEVCQRIELCLANSEVVANADIVVSCVQNRENLLYVVYAEKAKRLKSFQDHYIS